MAAKTKSVWERRARAAEKELERMTQQRDALRAQFLGAQETAQTYATRYGKLNLETLALGREKRALEQRLKDEQAFSKDCVEKLQAELRVVREDNAALKRTDTELREEVRRLRKEAADHPEVVKRMAAELKKAQDELAVYQLTTTVEDAEEYLAQELKAEQEAHALTQAQLGALRARMKREAKAQTPPTCRCSDHEERIRALLERVVSLESRMNAVSAAADAGAPF